MPAIIGILVGTKALVRVGQGIVSPVSGEIDDAMMILFYL